MRSLGAVAIIGLVGTFGCSVETPTIPEGFNDGTTVERVSQNSDEVERFKPEFLDNGESRLQFIESMSVDISAHETMTTEQKGNDQASFAQIDDGVSCSSGNGSMDCFCTGSCCRNDSKCWCTGC